MLRAWLRLDRGSSGAGLAGHGERQGGAGHRGRASRAVNRIVIDIADKNIFVSTPELGGLPLAFLDHARAGAFRLGASGPLPAEIREVLCIKFAWSDQEISAALSQLDDCRVRFDPTEMLDVIPDDPDDNRILECAIASQAGYIVSGDHHLLRLGNYRGIHILKVADFMLLLPTLGDSAEKPFAG
jgi:uncharacterized protein